MHTHPIEAFFGLTANEILDAIQDRFRLKVAVGGAVAEVQMEKHVASLPTCLVDNYKANDIDGHPDFSIYLKGRKDPILAECKNARNESYMRNGVLENYKVEVQKTRASNNDPTSRFYGFDQFQILGVCLGNQTGDWTNFMFIRTTDLPPHRLHSQKIQILNRVPLLDGELGHWSTNLADIVRKIE